MLFKFAKNYKILFIRKLWLFFENIFLFLKKLTQKWLEILGGEPFLFFFTNKLGKAGKNARVELSRKCKSHSIQVRHYKSKQDGNLKN